MAYGKPLPLTVAGAVEDQVPASVHPTPFPFESPDLAAFGDTLQGHMGPLTPHGQCTKRRFWVECDARPVSIGYRGNAGDGFHAQVAQHPRIGKVAIMAVDV